MNSYTYRYIPNTQKIKVICKPFRSNDLRHYHVLSDSFQSKERRNRINVIIGFANEDMAKERFNWERRKAGIKANDIEISTIIVQDLQEFCKLIRMPLLVYVNECSNESGLCEVYFKDYDTEGYLHDFVKASKKYNLL